MNLFPRLRLRSDEKELTAISFAFLLLTDVFVAYILFFGLSRQIEQFSGEYDYFPYRYRGMLIEKTWVENTVIQEIAADSLARARSTREPQDRLAAMHPDCKAIETQLRAISGDPTLFASLEAYDRLRENYAALEVRQQESAEGDRLLADIETMERELKARPAIVGLIESIYRAQGNDYAPAIKNFRRLFAAKRVAFDFLFLLPVVALFILWNRVSQKRESSLNVVISSHYILVSLIPILFEILRLILEVIPTVFLKTVYDLLVSLKLITLWYYAVLFLSIVFVIFVIWILQTKIFTQEKHDVKRYGKGRCMSCDARVDYLADFCPVCGKPLSTECPACGGRTVRGLPFCVKCGKGLRIT